MGLHSNSAACVVLLLVVPLALFLPFAVLIALPLALFAVTLTPTLYPCQLQRQYFFLIAPHLRLVRAPSSFRLIARFLSFLLATPRRITEDLGFLPRSRRTHGIELRFSLALAACAYCNCFRPAFSSPTPTVVGETRSPTYWRFRWKCFLSDPKYRAASRRIRYPGTTRGEDRGRRRGRSSRPGESPPVASTAAGLIVERTLAARLLK